MCLIGLLAVSDLHPRCGCTLFKNLLEALLDIGVPVLVALGFILRFDITRIECRTAAIRRLMKSLGSTHCSYIRDVSADSLRGNVAWRSFSNLRNQEKGPAARCQWSLSESEGQDPKDREVQRSRNWRWWSPACCYAGCFVGHQACIQAGLLRSLEGCKPCSPGLETERFFCCTGARASGPCTNHRAQEWVSQDCTLQEDATAGGRLGL